LKEKCYIKTYYLIV